MQTAESFFSFDLESLNAPVSWHHPAHPVDLRVGRGAILQLPNRVTRLPALVVSTRNSVDRSGRRQAFSEGDGWHVFHEVAPNPGPEIIEKAARFGREREVQTIVGLGGGSALDAARCVSLMSGQFSTVDELQAHIQEGRPLERQVDLIQAPTTAGTGSEVTPWASVWDSQGQKSSVDHPAGFADRAFVDPSLSDSMPPRLTAAVGLDAMTHAMEALWGRHGDSVSDSLATSALELLYAHLPAAISAPTSRDRNAVSAGSLLAGMALSRTRSAIAHALSYPLTGRYQVEHGFAVGVMAIAVLKLPEIDAPAGRDAVVSACRGSTALDVAETLRDIFKSIGVTPTLSSLGLPVSMVDELIETASASNRLGNMPGVWDESRLARLLSGIA
ncbi:MAG: phosphonoacetaldehyde reductase [Myxococcota bacterium]|nr:phosphonoacetaldehyde reductase [Myxococcota bacterium]